MAIAIANKAGFHVYDEQTALHLMQSNTEVQKLIKQYSNYTSEEDQLFFITNTANVTQLDISRILLHTSRIVGILSYLIAIDHVLPHMLSYKQSFENMFQLVYFNYSSPVKFSIKLDPIFDFLKFVIKEVKDYLPELVTFYKSIESAKARKEAEISSYYATTLENELRGKRAKKAIIRTDIEIEQLEELREYLDLERRLRYSGIDEKAILNRLSQSISIAHRYGISTTELESAKKIETIENKIVNS